ncbi:hypothetical protein G4G27_13340 [Sphingomonas sp. So64.6b]|uniref:hypothetical protein n=1 Tax=Sphingomonas sp. So64.6b TaxID=2997354 RepID=UPI0016039F02|nr:hypothetical protein [Sphingomonas sp. So64.6b]QNA84870.1 hypothetical protein G4G27_13340 [Sphingomonas sp. So64.6b]
MEHGIVIQGTPAFLIASLANGLALAALVMAIDRVIAPKVSALRRRWLERRLRRRLARGDDRYFEELRSIETALQAHSEKPLASSRFETVEARLVQAISIPLFGAIILTWLLPKDGRPAWTEVLPQTIFILIGLQLLSGISGFGERPTIASRLAGLLVIATFTGFLLNDISKLT